MTVTNPHLAPPMPVWGVVGHNIDRCISSTGKCIQDFRHVIADSSKGVILRPLFLALVLAPKTLFAWRCVQLHQFSLHFERVGLRKCRCACPVSLHFYCHMGGRRSYANRCVQSEVKRGVAWRQHISVA